MTTHSMEEADVLGDRIGIMASGRIRAVGGSLALKKQYGSGYKISIITEPTMQTAVKQIIKNNMPSARLEDDAAGSLIYCFPESDLVNVSSVVKKLCEERTVKEWGISQTSLEQVFLGLVRNDLK
jgi:ABC-type multidrug transport system ATPase subunit